MSPTSLETNAELLRALSNSPIVEATRKELEAQKVAKRAEVLDTLKREESAALAEAERLGRAADDRRVKVEQLAVRLAEERMRLFEAQVHANNASDQVERVRNHARRQLSELDGYAIDRVLASLGAALTRSLAGVGYEARRDPYGNQLPPYLKTPDALGRCDRYRAWMHALEAIRMDPTWTPRAIAELCSKAEAELAGQPAAELVDLEPWAAKGRAGTAASEIARILRSCFGDVRSAARAAGLREGAVS